MTSTERPAAEIATAVGEQILGEPLTYHGPGWVIETDQFEVICWAPGEIVHVGRPTGRLRRQWLLSVEIGPLTETDDGDTAGPWASGGFASGDSLAEVLPALSLLTMNERELVESVLSCRLLPKAHLTIEPLGGTEAGYV